MLTYQYDFTNSLEIVKDKAGKHIGEQFQNGIANYLVKELLQDESVVKVIEGKKTGVDPALNDCYLDHPVEMKGGSR